MAIDVISAQLTYYPVPKCACTSLKHFFFEVNNGFSFEHFSKMSGFKKEIHQLPSYATRPPKAEMCADVIPSFRKFCVIRDPFKRAYSAYVNKVVSGDFVRGLKNRNFNFDSSKIEPAPSFGSFFGDLDSYSRASPLVAHHLQNPGRFLPQDIFENGTVIRLEDHEALSDFTTQIGQGVTLPRRNTTKKSSERQKFSLTKKEFQSGMEFLGAEYKFLSRYYSPLKYTDL